MPKNKESLAIIAFLSANVIWGAANPIIKYTLGYIPPFTFLFLRLLIVCIILLPFTIIKLIETKINKKDYFNFLILGLLSQSSLAIIFLAMEFTSALDATVISIVTGAMIVYAGHYFYKEKINHLIKIGIVFTIIGTLIAVLDPILSGVVDHVPAGNRIVGNIMVLFYNLTWVLYVLLSKMSSTKDNPKPIKKSLTFLRMKTMTKPYSPILISFVTMYVGLLTVIPLAILENLGFFSFIPLDNFNILAIDAKGIYGLLYMAILSSIGAYTLNQWALANGKISESAIFAYLGPVFSFPIAYLLLGEVPTSSLIIGAIIIAFGVILAESGSQKANGIWKKH